MFFNSWEFGLFVLVVWTGYALLRSVRAQNLLLLAASYWFYAAWDWRFLGLIIVSTAVDFVAGWRLHAASGERARRGWLTLSLAVNLGLLGFFKYFDFFVDGAGALLAGAGLDASGWRLDIVLPVGISFYTFQTMSYTLDIYRRQLEPVRRLDDFALFVAFFPQLVAGPIERARTLLPQIVAPRRITRDGLATGLWLVFWGLWKKVFVADNLAVVVDRVFDGSASAGALEVWLGAFAFAWQIYCDFSGYSDVARGLARIMGFELMVNFDLPYVARSPGEFWRRWHISLSTWLRDYLYIPLGGNRRGRARTYVNLMITMTLGGLWHGASWNFVWWGVFHGALLCVYRHFDGERPRRFGAVGAVRWALMFHLTLFGWLLFRATRRVVDASGLSRDDSWAQIQELLGSVSRGVGQTAAISDMAVSVLAFVGPLILVQVLQHRSRDALIMRRWPVPGRALLVAYMLLTWVLYGVQEGVAFLYFQF